MSELLELKEKLKIISEERRFVIEDLIELRKNPEVIKFEELLKKTENLKNEYSLLESKYAILYQEECTHNLWVYISDDTDSYEMRKLWLCKCARCGKEEIKHPKEFKQLIGPNKNLSYYEIVNKYNFFFSETQNEEESIILTKKLIY